MTFDCILLQCADSFENVNIFNADLLGNLLNSLGIWQYDFSIR